MIPLLRRIWTKPNNWKVAQMMLNIGRFVESFLGDWYLNVNTRGVFRIDHKLGINQDAHDFETVAHCAVKKAIKLAEPTASDVVYVLGSGKGRAVCHFARQRVQKVVGIEISRELCEIAKKNTLTLRHKKSSVEIRNADVALTDISDGTIFFMFNPFGEKTLLQVLSNIDAEQCHRPIRIIYMNPKFSRVFNKFPSFEITFDYRRRRGQHVIIYQYNRNAANKKNV